MDYKKFNDTEEKYRTLRGKLNRGEITALELKAELKNLMVQDEEGNYWMIGGKTGKWYIYNGSEWKEENPYHEEEVIDASVGEIPIIDTYSEHKDTAIKDEQSEAMIEETQDQYKDESTEQDEKTVMEEQPRYEERVAVEIEHERREEVKDDATRVLSAQEERQKEIDESKPLLEKEIKAAPSEIECRVCKSRIPSFSVFCHICGANLKRPIMDFRRESKPVKKEDELLITAVNMISMIFFLGGLGIIIGVVVGATFGSIKELFMNHGLPIPPILEDTRGGVAGGLIFACIGGIGGFIIFAIASVIISSFCNLIAFIFGGIRFKIKT